MPDALRSALPLAAGAALALAVRAATAQALDHAPPAGRQPSASTVAPPAGDEMDADVLSGAWVRHPTLTLLAAEGLVAASILASLGRRPRRPASQQRGTATEAMATLRGAGRIPRPEGSHV